MEARPCRLGAKCARLLAGLKQAGNFKLETFVSPCRLHHPREQVEGVLKTMDRKAWERLQAPIESRLQAAQANVKFRHEDLNRCAKLKEYCEQLETVESDHAEHQRQLEQCGKSRRTHKRLTRLMEQEHIDMSRLRSRLSDLDRRDLKLQHEKAARNLQYAMRRVEQLSNGPCPYLPNCVVLHIGFQGHFKDPFIDFNDQLILHECRESVEHHPYSFGECKYDHPPQAIVEVCRDARQRAKERRDRESEEKHYLGPEGFRFHFFVAWKLCRLGQLPRRAAELVCRHVCEPAFGVDWLPIFNPYLYMTLARTEQRFLALRGTIPGVCCPRPDCNQQPRQEHSLVLTDYLKRHRPNLDWSRFIVVDTDHGDSRWMTNPFSDDPSAEIALLPSCSPQCMEVLYGVTTLPVEHLSDCGAVRPACGASRPVHDPRRCGPTCTNDLRCPLYFSEQCLAGCAACNYLGIRGLKSF